MPARPEYRGLAWQAPARSSSRFALSLPEAVEDHPWDETVVKVRGKIFVFLGPARSRRISVKLAESHAHALSIEGAEPTGYGLGRSGLGDVPLDADGRRPRASSATGSRRATGSSRRSVCRRARRRQLRIASISSAVGSDGCAPWRDAATAPAAHARASASSRSRVLEQRDEETGRERVARGRAVDRVDRGGAARATSSPSSSRSAPSAPSVTATSPSRRASASSSKRLTTVRSGSTATGRAGAAFRQNTPVHASHAASTASSGISS